MTTKEFVEWIKTTYETKTLKAAMIKAANFLGVSKHTIKARMKKNAVSENVAQVMAHIVENPPPPNYIASSPAEYVISRPTKSTLYEEYMEKSSKERSGRHDFIMTFFDAVRTAHDCKSLKEAARISASLLDENFNTVYYWAKGLSNPSQAVVDRAREILISLPANQPSRRSILENFLKWVAEKYNKTQPREIYNQAADILGISPATVARWIRENSMLKSSTVEHMKSLMNKKTSNDDLKKTSNNPAQEFIDWVQNKNKFSNRTAAVERASNMMHVTKDTIWKWLSGKQKTPPAMVLLMELLHEKYKEKGRHCRVLSEEQREEMRSMLGKKPDREIAAQLGISRFTVQAERYKLGIKRYCSPDGSRIQYDDEFIATLGKIPDFECAKRFGYSNSSVARIRKKHGIAPYKNPLKLHKPYKPRDPNKPRKKKEYPEELINMLGKFPDREIAKKFGYSGAGIALIRKNKGIPSFSDTKFPEEKREEMLSMLGKFPDREIAKKFGYSTTGIAFIRKNKGIPSFSYTKFPEEKREEMRSMLGKFPDREIAERLGISLNVVEWNRRKLKIAPAPYSPIKDADKDIILNLLGRVSDLKIAKKTGYSTYVIKKFREQNKIEPFSKSILERLTPKQRKKVLSMLGKVHDSVIAEKFNVTNETIRRIRKKMNVPALREKKSWQETIEGNESLRPLLGTMTDRELADKTGMARQVIGKIRRKLKIPPFDTRGARPEIYRQ